IVGACHYRRHFLLPDNWIRLFEDNNVDVILPVPLFVAPSIEANYVSRHLEKPWNTMLSIIKEKDEKQYERAKEFLSKTGCFSPCNMIIARKSVYDEFCSWLFPIILEVNKRIGTVDDKYQNRYPGFMAERMLSFYFYDNRDKLKVVYADKNFLK
ncbi:MAG: DUF4422 domain-containing protein, partial [Butyrivibrio sp.]|nr:DUF4422 domain-containing protein [Butyrivibrio sp.]